VNVLVSTTIPESYSRLLTPPDHRRLHYGYPHRVPTPTSVLPPAREAILAWYAERGRPLAFRRTRDPYEILVSEAMAQQTQAARAAAYWERFLELFPTLEALAAAAPADVLRAWQGLGYDRRALALWRTARIVVSEMGGRIPSTVAELEALPGVGPYTARAVAALAFGVPVGAVDVNVRRVLGRLVAGDAAAMSAAEIQRLADGSVPADRPGAWTHAVMDVGATLCRSRAPRCESCPVRSWCRFASKEPGESAVPAGSVASRPARKPSTPFTQTNRWLRGRILDRLRAAPNGEWVPLAAAIGTHDEARVRAAAIAMAADGVLEVAHPEDAGGRLRARLPLG
jgi:A/G-specific adenine glycosylase